MYLVGRDIQFFRVSFSPIFSRAGYQSKDVFLELIVNKAHFLQSIINSTILCLIFTVLLIFPTLFNFLMDFAAIC